MQDTWPRYGPPIVLAPADAVWKAHWARGKKEGAETEGGRGRSELARRAAVPRCRDVIVRTGEDARL